MNLCSKEPIIYILNVNKDLNFVLSLYLTPHYLILLKRGYLIYKIRSYRSNYLVRINPILSWSDKEWDLSKENLENYNNEGAAGKSKKKPL